MLELGMPTETTENYFLDVFRKNLSDDKTNAVFLFDRDFKVYVHSNKKIGALVELNCETDFVAKNDKFRELAHDIARHVASMNPQYLEAADIPQEVLENKRNEFMEEIKNSGKPEAVQKQILEGKMKKFSEEISLLEQPFVKNPDEKIKDLVNEYTGKIGENIKIGKFIRLEIL